MFSPGRICDYQVCSGIFLGERVWLGLCMPGRQFLEGSCCIFFLLDGCFGVITVVTGSGVWLPEGGLEGLS